MNIKIIAAFVLLSHQTSCANDPTGKPFEVENEIKEISFMGAHEERRCSKGCRYTEVPDTWYIQFCNTAKPTNCFTRSITHAPWSWQRPGTRVVVVWQPRERWWTLESIRLVGTNEEVRL